jgi:hypothetical protein
MTKRGYLQVLTKSPENRVDGPLADIVRAKHHVV